MKTIWIIDHYSSEPRFGGIRRQYDFAIELAKRGYKVGIIASSFSHFSHSYISEENMYVSEINDKVTYIYVRTSSYESNSGLKRAKNMYSFLRNVVKHREDIANAVGVPDVVTGCSVHPLAWLAAYWVARRYKIRFCIEVRDLWPWVWIASGEKSRFDPMVIFFGLLEKWAYKKADRIIFSMPKGDRYICDELGADRSKVALIGQPMDCEAFDRNALNKSSLPDEIIEFMKEGFICCFAGYYMKYEGVYVMLEAAKMLMGKGLPIKMVFVGSGEEREGMKRYVQDNRLNNVLIYGRIAKDAVPALLHNSDICMAHLEVENKSNAYKFGVSKNKVNEYLYSGACTLYGFMDTEDAVAVSGGGMVYTPYCAEELAEDIEKIYNMPANFRDMYGINGRKYIQENHNVSILTDKLLHVLFE